MQDLHEKTPLLRKEDSSCDITSKALSDRYPSQNSSLLSSILFIWINPVLKLGNRRPLEHEDLYQLDPNNRASYIFKQFLIYWGIELNKQKKPGIVWPLARAFGLNFIAAGFLKFIHDTLQFVNPLIIQHIIAYLTAPSASYREGLTYAGIVFLSGVIQSFCLRQYFYYCYVTGLRLRSAIVSVIYAKSLRISASARQKRSTGEITNLMSVDAQRLQDVTPYLHSIWYALYQICISCFLLWKQIGVATFAGFATILVLIPLTTMLSKLMRALQRKLMGVKDERVKICYEILAGIKIIKMKAWENSFTARVMERRKEELNVLRRYNITQCGSSTLFSFIPSVVTTVAFFTYAKLGNALDVGTALTSLALFNVLRFPLFMLPQVINGLAEVSVSCRRIRDFLLEGEFEAVGNGDLQSTGIYLNNVTLSWNSSTDIQELSTSPKNLAVLKNISFQGRSGELHAIIGQVGAGKSTLLSGILGDAKVMEGDLALRGSVAYVAQQPFIQNATIRENILFGKDFDEKRYEEAIQVSCLEKDLAILPGSDKTEIGEKGINLSGGQRTRVAIARAFYQDADIYIFDDVLSAVDSHVANDIFAKCIKGALKSKLVLLATHSLPFLSQCDNIIVLSNGSIAEQGPYKDIVKKADGILAHMMESYTEAENAASDIPPIVEDHSKEEPLTRPDTPRARSFSERTSSSASIEAETSDNISRLMTDEERSTGDVRLSIYLTWIQGFGGYAAILAVLLMYGIGQCISLSSTIWISYWSEHAKKDHNSQMYYVYVYTGINCILAVALYLRMYLLLSGGLRASQKIFDALFTRILLLPVSFFDTTPLGRIVNRLSKDIYTIDESIPATYGMVLNTFVIVLCTLGTILFVTPAFALLLAPVMVIYYRSQRYFIKTSRELQRLDSISRSPIYAMLSETLDGLSTIRAFRVEAAFRDRNRYLLDRNQRAYFLNFSVNCWLALRLEFVGTSIATGAALAAVLAHTFVQSSGTASIVTSTGVGSGPSSATFAGLVGVGLTYAFTVTQPLNWMARMVSQAETQMVSVERVQNYIELETEGALESSDDVKPPASWPNAGKIVFDNVRMRYRPGLPCVLRGLSLTIQPREKIGIVGRTGAGKSSLIVGLMRLTELDSGQIYIDDRDISKIGLHDLRSRLAIIPQDPVLFSGTVRLNLDPFSQYTDEQLWTSIKRVQLDRVVYALDAPVDEKGSNFSIGERQLLCIARALLQRYRIILMDEATASIDSETDRKIQKSIRQEFRECTCLTVAHRLNTIMDSDRVLVLEKGKVAEFGRPSELRNRENGMFKALVDNWKQGNTDV